MNIQNEQQYKVYLDGKCLGIFQSNFIDVSGYEDVLDRKNAKHKSQHTMRIRDMDNKPIFLLIIEAFYSSTILSKYSFTNNEQQFTIRESFDDDGDCFCFYTTSDNEKSIEITSINNLSNIIHLQSSLKWNMKVMSKFNTWYDANMSQHYIGCEKTNIDNIIPNIADIIQFTINDSSPIKCLITHVKKRDNGVFDFSGLTIDNQIEVNGFITNVKSTELCCISLPDSLYGEKWGHVKVIYIPLENIQYIT